MKENKLKVSFFVQAKRTDKKGLVPVIGRISVGRTHSGFSTKCKTPLTHWDSRKQRLIGKSSMAVSVNQKLGECTALIHTRFHELSERKETFTATDVRDAYQGQIHRQALLLESFGEYLTQTKERIGIDRALKTFKLRTYQLSLLREYVQKKHKVSDIPLSQLDKTFIEGFEYYLTIDRRLKRSSISSALSTLQTIVRKVCWIFIHSWATVTSDQRANREVLRRKNSNASSTWRLNGRTIVLSVICSSSPAFQGWQSPTSVILGKKTSSWKKANSASRAGE